MDYMMLTDPHGMPHFVNLPTVIAIPVPAGKYLVKYVYANSTDLYVFSLSLTRFWKKTGNSKW